jgi:hypothetical protein
MGISPQTVANQMTKALAQLREVLEPHFYSKRSGAFRQKSKIASDDQIAIPLSSGNRNTQVGSNARRLARGQDEAGDHIL